MPIPTKDFNVAIVGGGMCGLVCAVALLKAGIHTELFEQAAKFEEIGAGLSLRPNALLALEKLGLLQAVLERSGGSKPAQPPMGFISGTGTHEVIYDYPYTDDDLGLGIYRKVIDPFCLDNHPTFRYRPAFLEALVPMLDPSLLHFHHRCISVTATSSGSHCLHFDGGKVHETDLVIGADGIRSIIRAFITGGPSPPTYSNTDAYRGLIPTEVLEKAGIKTNLTHRSLCWIGRDEHFITYPIQAGKLMNIVAFSTNAKVPIGSPQLPLPWVKSVTEDELLSDYSGWGNDAHILLQQIKKPSKWSIHLLYPSLTTYVRQGVVLVGDSAHAMVPHLGAGVGQGFEDAFVLCKLLMDPRARASNLPKILNAYDRVRVPRTNMVHQESIIAGDIYEGRGEMGNTMQDTQQQLRGMWDAVWHHDLLQDLERAVIDAFGTTELEVR